MKVGFTGLKISDTSSLGYLGFKKLAGLHLCYIVESRVDVRGTAKHSARSRSAVQNRDDGCPHTIDQLSLRQACVSYHPQTLYGEIQGRLCRNGLCYHFVVATVGRCRTVAADETWLLGGGE